MSTNQITVVGNLTRRPELRHTPNGHAVLDLTVAENHRRRDPNSGEWRDVSRNYYTVTCWRKLAEHVARSLDKGHAVIVVGRLYVDEWTDRDNILRKTPKIDPISVGFDLRYSQVYVPPRPSSDADRSPSLARRSDTEWPEPEDGPEDGPEDPFDPADVDGADAVREVAALPGSER